MDDFKPRKHRYNANPLEKNVEAAMLRRAKKLDFIVLFRKNAAGGIYASRDFPDRTVFGLYGFTMHVEVKRKGAKATEGQAKMIKLLRKAGHTVHLIDDADVFTQIVTKEYAAWLERIGVSVKVRLPRSSSVAASRRSSRVSTRSSASPTRSKRRA